MGTEPKTVRVRVGLEMPSSLIHELVHAAVDAYGVGLDEKEVAALANGLAQALTSLELLPATICLERPPT